MKLFLSYFHTIFNSEPKERDQLQKWNEAFAAFKEVRTHSVFICINHFNEEDIVRKGKLKPVITLKKTAVPSVFAQTDCVDYVDPVNFVEPNDENEASQDVDVLLETNSLQQHLNEEREKNERMQQEMDEKKYLIQKLTNDLNKFQNNSLAQFAVRASENVEVIS